MSGCLRTYSYEQYVFGDQLDLTVPRSKLLSLRPVQREGALAIF
jgi:hypothetical protein